jgi:hypothetical protein
MRKRTFDRFANSALVALLFLYGCSSSQVGTPLAPPQGGGATVHRSSVRARSRPNTTPATTFTVSGRDILLNGKTFYIKGMNYSPTQIDAYPDANPLDDANEPIWSADLAQMRAAGINTIKVYNISLDSFRPYFPILGQNFSNLRKDEKGKIGKFLDAAWNNGDHPIYVVLSLAFATSEVTIPKYAQTLKTVYELAAKEYAAYPAFMGFSIGNEINTTDLIQQPAWWAGLNTMVDGIHAGYKAANAQKITTTTMIDDGLKTVTAGEDNHFKVDVWGVTVYRGWTFSHIWTEFYKATKRPAQIAEYGYSSGYYPPSTARFDETTHVCALNTYPAGSHDAPYYGLPGPRPWELIRELPATGNPNSGFLSELVTLNATELYQHSTTQPGADSTLSGGFYFEWNDEWWKSGWPRNPQIGGEGNVISINPVFPGCYRDEGWFGLNGDKVTMSGRPPFPGRTPDKRIPRPALAALKAVFTSEP